MLIKIPRPTRSGGLIFLQKNNLGGKAEKSECKQHKDREFLLQDGNPQCFGIITLIKWMDFSRQQAGFLQKLKVRETQVEK